MARSLLKLLSHRDAISLFLYNSPFLALLCLIKMKYYMSLRYAFGRFVFKFHKNWMCDDYIVTSFKVSLDKDNCPYLKFYWIYKLHTWYQYIITWGTGTSNDYSKVTLTHAEGHRWRSQMVLSNKQLHQQISYLVPRYNTISNI